MAEILITDIVTKAAAGTPGTGIFDLLMENINLYLQQEYNSGRITGAEYATVYLGALDSVLNQAVAFGLTRQEADKKAELLNVQISEANERIEEVTSRTAKNYEDIKASQEKTLRENLLNNSVITKITEETDLIIAQEAEVLSKTARESLESENRIASLNHDISIKAEQNFKLNEQNGIPTINYKYYVNGTDGATTTTTNLSNVVGPVLGTSMVAGAGESIVSLEKEILKSKDLLVEAQTLGFKSDTKQKVLKLMTDGYAVNLSVSGTANVPEAVQDASIDQLVQEILNDVGTTVTIQSITQVPATGD